MSDEIPVGVHIGSKGCRERYSKPICGCPHGRCWVSDARAAHKRGEPAPTTNAWLNALAAEHRPCGLRTLAAEEGAEVTEVEETEPGVWRFYVERGGARLWGPPRTEQAAAIADQMQYLALHVEGLDAESASRLWWRTYEAERHCNPV